MIVVCIILVAMGLVFETLSMVIIMVPVLLPAAMAIGGSYLVWYFYGDNG